MNVEPRTSANRSIVPSFWDVEGVDVGDDSLICRRKLDTTTALRTVNECDALVSANQMQTAEDRLAALIDSLDPELAAELSPKLLQVVGRFYPNRRKRLTLQLNAAKYIQDFSVSQITDLRKTLRDGLTDLSDRHIFQWSTFYRDLISETLVNILQTAYSPSDLSDTCGVVRQEFTRHSTEIFEKGYEHTVAPESSAHNYAINKSLSGLQRFLEIPIDLYSAQAQRARVGSWSNRLRQTTSAMMAGILLGYANASFRNRLGGAVLPSSPRSWAHYMGFLTAVDLEQLLMALEAGPFRDGCLANVLPVTVALDKVAHTLKEEQFTLPRLGQFTWDQRRLDIFLAPSLLSNTDNSLEIQCYIDDGFVNRRTLEEAAGRSVGIIVAPIRPDLRGWALSHDLLRTSLINTSPEAGSELSATHDRILELLQFSFSLDGKSGSANAPLHFNFARNFPLQNPFLSKYFHVYRGSVRRLLQTFELRNGIRLWCSVRRSGKTTACFDLESTTGTSVVVSQTCDKTAQDTNSDTFYEKFSDALELGKRIPPDFIRKTIEECSPSKLSESQRYVFVLDEYETLFERMRLAVKRDKEIRYTVVQPLLNQFVAFARDNLVVFIGQRPDAHYIIMDQNQLSPYVQQDPFPLFEHSEIGGEFRELVSRVLTERTTFDQEFLSAVYLETNGHPYLTVNLLVTFVDWLIASRRQASAMRFTESDYLAFSEVRLQPSFIRTSADYMLFRQIVSQALSEADDNRWLYAVYSCLRWFGGVENLKLEVSRKDFDEFFSKTLSAKTGFTSDQILATAGQANFLRFDEHVVGPKIPLLARIAAVAPPAIQF